MFTSPVYFRYTPATLVNRRALILRAIFNNDTAPDHSNDALRASNAEHRALQVHRTMSLAGTRCPNKASSAIIFREEAKDVEEQIHDIEVKSNRGGDVLVWTHALRDHMGIVDDVQ